MNKIAHYSYISYNFNSANSILLFSLRSTNRLLRPSLEGHVVSVDTTDGYYLCQMAVEPFGSKTVDFSEFSYSPLVGEVFSVSLRAWSSSDLYPEDFVWVTDLINNKVRKEKYLSDAFSFCNLNSYNVALFFRMQSYFTNGINKRRPIKDPTYMLRHYNLSSGPEVFFMRQRANRIYRAYKMKPTTIVAVLSPVFPISKNWLFMPLFSNFSDPLVSLLSVYEVCWRLCFFFKFLRSFKRKHRRQAKKGLVKLAKSRQRQRLFRYVALTPLLGLSYFQVSRSLFSLRLRDPFELFISFCLISSNEPVSHNYGSFMWYTSVRPIDDSNKEEERPSFRRPFFYFPPVQSKFRRSKILKLDARMVRLSRIARILKRRRRLLAKRIIKRKKFIYIRRLRRRISVKRPALNKYRLKLKLYWSRRRSRSLIPTKVR